MVTFDVLKISIASFRIFGYNRILHRILHPMNIHEYHITIHENPPSFPDPFGPSIFSTFFSPIKTLPNRASREERQHGMPGRLHGPGVARK